MFIGKLERYYEYFSRRKAGWFILCSVLTLIACGLVTLSSASLSFIKSNNYFLKQLAWCAIGIPFFLCGSLMDLQCFKRHSGKILFILSIGLILVLIPGIGRLVNGSRRWISIGSMNIQVSEFAKIALIGWVAMYCERTHEYMHTFRYGFFTPLSIAGIVCIIILLEPDYGTAILMGAVTFTVLVLAGSRLLYMSCAMGLGGCLISILIYLNPTRMRRIVAFLDVENNKLGGAYQLWQGMLGFVSGGLFGKGLGEGRQQIVYLPESHTDFIFPIFSEELGSIAAIIILCIYFTLFISIMIASKNLINKFYRYLSYGISLTLAYQVVINVGVVTGLLPTKGMVLPFMSYGGSNLVLLLFMVGLVLNTLVSDVENQPTEDGKSPSRKMREYCMK